MTSLRNKLREIGIVPVIKISDASKAVDLAKALWDGGIRSAEITFRTDAAASSLFLTPSTSVRYISFSAWRASATASATESDRELVAKVQQHQ